MMLTPNTIRRVRKDLQYGEWYGNHVYVDDTNQFLGKEITIDMVWINNNVATIKEDPTKRLHFSESMFEPLENIDTKIDMVSMPKSEPPAVDEAEMEKEYRDCIKGKIIIDGMYYLGFVDGWKRRGGKT